MQFTFDATQVAPDTGEGGGFIPVSTDPRGTLVNVIGAGDGNGNLMVTNRAANGAFMPLTVKILEGPDAGKEGVYRLNLQHEKPDVMMRGYAELSAVLHVTGVMRIQNDIRELFGKPFRLVSELQDTSKPDGYTQLARGGIRDINGNKAGKAGQQAQVAQPAPQPQPGGMPGNGGGWGAPQPGGAAAPVQQPAAAPPPGWGGQPMQPAPAPAPAWGGPPQGGDPNAAAPQWGGGAPAPAPQAPTQAWTPPPAGAPGGAPWGQ